jgi:hypothetical protein
VRTKPGAALTTRGQASSGGADSIFSKCTTRNETKEGRIPMKTTNRMIETVTMLATWATLALAGSACETESAIALHPDAAPTVTPHATGGTVATSQAADPPAPLPDAAVVQAQGRPDAGPIVADAAPPVVVDAQMEAGPVVLGSCGVGLEEILVAGVASCVPVPGYVPDASAPDAGPVSECVQLGDVLAANGIDCVRCFAGTCWTSTCGNGLLEAGELCDCGSDPLNLPAGCHFVNGGDDLGDGKGCTTECLRMEVTSAP